MGLFRTWKLIGPFKLFYLFRPERGNEHLRPFMDHLKLEVEKDQFKLYKGQLKTWNIKRSIQNQSQNVSFPTLLQ